MRGGRRGALVYGYGLVVRTGVQPLDTGFKACYDLAYRRERREDGMSEDLEKRRVLVERVARLYQLLRVPDYTACAERWVGHSDNDKYTAYVKASTIDGLGLFDAALDWWKPDA